MLLKGLLVPPVHILPKLNFHPLVRALSPLFFFILLQDTMQFSDGKFLQVEFPVIGRAFAEKILDRLSYYNVGKTEDSNIMWVYVVIYFFLLSKVISSPHSLGSSILLLLSANVPSKHCKLKLSSPFIEPFFIGRILLLGSRVLTTSPWSIFKNLSTLSNPASPLLK